MAMQAVDSIADMGVNADLAKSSGQVKARCKMQDARCNKEEDVTGTAGPAKLPVEAGPRQIVR
jgi:hypothetical protein